MENDETTPVQEQDDNQNLDVTPEQSEDDGTDWKAEALKYKAILARNKDKPKHDAQAPKKSDELGYDQKAFLISNGIKGADEFALVKQIMQESGKSLDDVIESKYFQNELNERREMKKTDNANPGNSKRTGQSAQDSVDYWIAKGELPPASNTELRRQVINARIKNESSKGVFYNS